MKLDSAELEALARTQLETSAALKLDLAARSELIVELATVWAQAIAAGNQVLFCGNGGSAADAQHLAGELVGGLGFTRHRGYAAAALTANVAILTALANDHDYESVFERHLSAVGRPGDVLVAISTSGNSENVLRAVQSAKAMGIVTMAFTGDSGQLKDRTDHVLGVQSSSAPRVQEAYMAAGHVMCSLVESLLGETTKGPSASD